MNPSPETRRTDVAGAVLVALLAAAFAWFIGLRPDGAWYSASPAHRLQTDAFFRGAFALQPVPNGQMADWVWARGSQQVWGLGVPFLRFPFEVLARLTGGGDFPDRITLLLVFTVVAAVFARAFRDRPPWERACLLMLTAFAPPLVALCRTRLSVYEEASACACLWGLLLAGTLMQLARWPSRRLLLAVCLVAGVAPFFRPTLIFSGLVSVAVAMVLAWRHQRRAGPLLAGAALFGLGLACVGATNFLRFGSPLETGQLLNVSYIPVDQFSKIFGYPFWKEPWTSAALELVSSLCLANRWNGVDWYQDAIHPGQSSTLRFREFYFSTFTPVVLVVLAASWIAAAALRRSLRRLGDPRIATAAAWSASVFAILFLFYLWAPSMTSRYAVDFVPAVATGLAGLFLALMRAVEGRPRAWSLAIAATGIAWVSHDIATAGISPTHRTPLLVTGEVMRERLPRPTMQADPLPDGYRCGENPERFGVKFNGSGWAWATDCSVDAGSMFFLADVDCLQVHVAPRSDDAALTATQLSFVRAKAGLTELQRTATEATDDGARLTFCSPPQRKAVGSGIEVVYLGWMDPSLVKRGSRPLRLLDLRKVTR